MTCTTYSCWVSDGKPWKNCQPINDLIATLYGHGYTGPQGGIGDQSHLTATPPEDHCPYSHTPWPGAQPYPYVLALDIMSDCGLDIIDLGGRLFDDKSSNKPGTEPIKYINWTDSDGNCWHDSWMPNHTRYVSTDRGHIHISFRTDYVTSTRMATYDPYGGSDMTPDQAAQLNVIYQLLVSATGLGSGGDYAAADESVPGPAANNNLFSKLNHIMRCGDRIEQLLSTMPPGSGVTIEQVRAEIAASVLTPPND